MKGLSGKHMTIDGIVADAVVLNEKSLESLIDAIVVDLGMTYLHRPIACSVPMDESKLNTEDDEGGVSCFAQITTSHIAIHGWPLKRGFMMDIFSCRDFDADRSRAIVFDALGVVSANVKVHQRTGPKP